MPGTRCCTASRCTRVTEGRLASLVVEHLPLPLPAANAALQVVPRDGRMRNLVIDKAWFAPGRLDAARYLWEMTRWEWRAVGTSLLLTHDPRPPVHQVVAARRWLPTRARRPPSVHAAQCSTRL
jgi:hypothetical protein